MSDHELPERVHHDQLYALANHWHSCERAISEGRDLAYAILQRTDPETHETLRNLANFWLDTHGRKPSRKP